MQGGAASLRAKRTAAAGGTRGTRGGGRGTKAARGITFVVLRYRRSHDRPSGVGGWPGTDKHAA